MATYRIIFSDTPNPTTMFIEAQTIKQEGPSYIFLDANNNVVSVFPLKMCRASFRKPKANKISLCPATAARFPRPP